MVAPCEVGEPVQSYVRVSTMGSGVRAFCWDLSRSSTMVANAAPLHPIQSNLNHQGQHRPSSHIRVFLKPSRGQDRRDPTHTQSQQSPQRSVVTPREPKHPREEEKQNEGSTGTLKRPREEEEEEGVEGQCVIKVAKYSEGTGEPKLNTQAQKTDEKMEGLREQYRALCQKNEDLPRRLSMFLDLLRDRQCLRIYVKRPNTEVM